MRTCNKMKEKKKRENYNEIDEVDCCATSNDSNML